MTQHTLLLAAASDWAHQPNTTPPLPVLAHAARGGCRLRVRRLLSGRSTCGGRPLCSPGSRPCVPAARPPPPQAQRQQCIAAALQQRHGRAACRRRGAPGIHLLLAGGAGSSGRRRGGGRQGPGHCSLLLLLSAPLLANAALFPLPSKPLLLREVGEPAFLSSYNRHEEWQLGGLFELENSSPEYMLEIMGQRAREYEKSPLLRELKTICYWSGSARLGPHPGSLPRLRRQHRPPLSEVPSWAAPHWRRNAMPLLFSASGGGWGGPPPWSRRRRPTVFCAVSLPVCLATFRCYVVTWARQALRRRCPHRPLPSSASREQGQGPRPNPCIHLQNDQMVS